MAIKATTKRAIFNITTTIWPWPKILKDGVYFGSTPFSKYHQWSGNFCCLPCASDKISTRIKWVISRYSLWPCGIYGLCLFTLVETGFWREGEEWWTVVRWCSKVRETGIEEMVRNKWEWDNGIHLKVRKRKVSPNTQEYSGLTYSVSWENPSYDFFIIPKLFIITAIFMRSLTLYS